jgi:hypothetical protein
MTQTLRTFVLGCFFLTSVTQAAPISIEGLRTSEVKLDSRLLSDLKKPNSSSRFLALIEGSVPKATADFLSTKINATGGTKILIESDRSNWFVINVDRLRIPIQFSRIDQTGAASFNVNGRIFSYTSIKSLEENWNAILAILPKADAKHAVVELLIPKAEAAGGPLILAAAIGLLGMAAVMTNNHICRTYDFIIKICQDDEVDALDILKIAQFDAVKLNPMRLARCGTKMDDARACLKARGSKYGTLIPENLKEYFGVPGPSAG